MSEEEVARLRARLEEQQAKLVDEISKEQLRQRNAIVQLEVVDSANEVKVHDVERAVNALGKKYDELYKELKDAEVVTMSKRVRMMLAAALIGGLSWAGNLLLSIKPDG